MFTMPPLNVLLLFFFFLFLSQHPLSSAASLPRNPEVEALMSIKEGLNDPHGVLSNWDEFSVDPCSWPMITCSSDYQVIGLGAPSQNLSGTLSSAIANLTNLKQVLLQNNNISGKIPPELGNLPKLQTLDLSNNRFSGFIPPSLSQLNSLQYLRLNNNSLSGPFPASLAKITQLAFLDLSYNNLSGPLPKFVASIVGNPLICLSISIEGCSGSVTLMPVPFSQASSEGKHKSKKLAIALGVSFSFVSLVILFLGLFWYRKKRQHGAILYIGGSLAVHRNLLRLIGYCATTNEKLLVYPYMANGSVASRLRDN
ncbi:hypothetical protein TSUD_200870 [Trifolium subterraneum]|uniref:Leucine-rich repeat-containing N-terminal plant-type domain-containing protein n=1 Tax=Trifolium subterraneum TaxID=3900 RepID=A0A2Z6MEE1_TRISU|nr:hypothetical protein TSUD_200870 [Trifolium subterraneum]